VTLRAWHRCERCGAENAARTLSEGIAWIERHRVEHDREDLQMEQREQRRSAHAVEIDRITRKVEQHLGEVVPRGTLEQVVAFTLSAYRPRIEWDELPPGSVRPAGDLFSAGPRYACLIGRLRVGDRQFEARVSLSPGRDISDQERDMLKDRLRYDLGEAFTQWMDGHDD
jgi:hypothetical protein